MLIDYLAAIRALLRQQPSQEADAPLASPELLWADGMRRADEDDPREWAPYGIGSSVR